MATTGKTSALLTAVEEVRFVLEANIENAERSGTLPDEAVQALVRSGLMTMKLPVELGGPGASLLEQALAIKAISSIYPSAGWCVMIGTTSIWLPAVFLPPEARKEFLEEGIPLAATVVKVSGQAVPIKDGYTLNGDWDFASGIFHAQWITAQAMVVRDGQPTGPRMFVFRAKDAKIRDNWRGVLGLRGTGSASFGVSNLFVPQHFSWDMERDMPNCGAPISLLGIPGSIFYEHVFFALGVAERALDEIIQRAPTLSRSYGPPAPPLSENQTFREEIAHMRLGIQSVEAMGTQLLSEALAVAETGNTPDMATQVRFRAFAAYATQVALKVTDTCFDYAGGRAVLEDDVLGLCFRDMRTAAQHLLPDKGASYGKYGRVLLGEENVHPMV